jgi:hypothetical protein
MKLIEDHILKDINLARDLINKSNISVVVIKNGVILSKKSGNGLRPMLEVIIELDKEIYGSVIGDKILGRASAFLCIYCKSIGVYSPQSTKKAISILSKEGIPYQIDKIIPFIQNKNGDDICPFEKMIENIESPIEAYKILKQNIIK